MYLSETGSEKPVARIDGQTYVDLSDAGTFFGGGGLDRIRPVVTERAAAGQVARFGGERIGAPIRRPHQIRGLGARRRHVVGPR
jgi:hypothetical protein